MNQSKYLIKDLENLTGIKSHTIRIWEKRYGLLRPKRTDTNIRYYDDEDLKKILNVNLLNRNGLKISKISILSEQELLRNAKSIIDKNHEKEPPEIQELTTAILRLDSFKVHEILEKLFQKRGVIDMYQNILQVFLVRIGELWQLNTIQISHEHLFSNALRDFIIGKINLIRKDNTGKKALLFLPEEEEHELPLLFYHYLIMDKGWQCVYLGQKVPVEELERAYSQSTPDVVITSLIKSTSSKQFNYILKKILEVVPEHKLWISGSNTITYHESIPKGVSTIHNLSDFVRIFN